MLPQQAYKPFEINKPQKKPKPQPKKKGLLTRIADKISDLGGYDFYESAQTPEDREENSEDMQTEEENFWFEWH